MVKKEVKAGTLEVIEYQNQIWISSLMNVRGEENEIKARACPRWGVL